MNFDASIVIDRPQREVFAFVTDVANMARWVTGVSSAEMVNGAMREGARFVCRYTSALAPNELEMEVASFEEPSRFGLRVARGPVNFEGTMTFTEVDGGTLVSNSIVGDPDSVATKLASLLFGWVVRPSMRKRLGRELETLRSEISREELADA